MRARPAHPVDTFTSLSKPSGQIRDLWETEKETLDKYNDECTDKKLVAINLPTGSGKSIIGLLILESWRMIGKRVAILTSSNALCVDLDKRCKDMGIQSVIIRGKGRDELENRERINNIKAYKRGQAIGIMNYWAYMLAKDIAEPDILVVDDADNFETVLIQQSSITVNRDSDPNIWDQIWAELNKYKIYQNLESYAMRQSRDESELIYFTHSVRIAERAKSLILSKARSDLSDELFWRFDENKDKMLALPMYISGENVVFSPVINVGVKHERLKNLQQIIFMSATLGTSEMLHRMMGSEEEIFTISESNIQNKLGTMGERIIFPIDEISSPMPEDQNLQQAVLRICQEFRKVLLLAPSKYDAREIQNFLKNNGLSVFFYNNESDVDQFSRLQSGVLISGGRLVGLDLPDETCRIAIITRMPFVVNPADGFSKQVLEDYDYVNEKVGHRLVQACGRCNRSPKDYAIYFILDSRLASDILGNEDLFRYFPARMKAEMDYGQEYASTGGLDRAIEIGKLFLSRKLPGFSKDIESKLASSEKITISSNKPFRKEIEAWYNLVERRNYLDAARDFELCSVHYQQLGDLNEQNNRQRAWMHYLAAYSYYLAFRMFGTVEYKHKAIDNLELSIKFGRSSWFSGLQVIINEIKESKEKESVIRDLGVQSMKERILRSWEEFRRTNTTKKRNPKQQWNSYADILLNGSHSNVVATLKHVLETMGYEVRNTSGENGKPDLLVFGAGAENHLILVEVKTKDEGGDVKREDVDQIAGHRINYQKEYPNYNLYFLLFMNKEKFSDTAITKSKNNVSLLRAIEFVSFLNKYVDLMERGWNTRILVEKVSVMEKIPTPDDLIVIFKPSDNPLITIDSLEKIVKW